MDIVQLTKDNMLDYAGAVNQSRAIPDARTGLKPIHRKILYEMHADKIHNKGKYKKNAYMVGQIIARFSEHGDSATYDALVRLAQPWIQRYPLLDFHGNSGSQFGDPAASMRYTESKLSKIAEQGFLYNLEKDSVDWIPTFTNEEQEPVTLPAIFPGLFCLPNQGIGYAVACNFLTYNLTDVAYAIKTYIETNEIPIIYYDLASGGTFINPSIMNQIYKSGKGSVIIDAKYEIKNQTIYITEIPFNNMFDDILDNIVKLVESSEIIGITDIRNNSGKGQLCMEIDVHKDYEPQTIMNLLLAKTKLRASYGVNQVALVNNKPKLLSMKEMIDVYITHNIQCIKRQYQYDYNKTQARIHIIEALLIAIDNIDEVINIIRNNDNVKTKLMEVLQLDNIQVSAILDMKLGRLSKLEKDKLEKELQEKISYANYCKEIIENENKQKDILITQLQDLAKTYDTPRRTLVQEKEIIKISKNNKSVKELIPEDVVVLINANGYIKSIPTKSFKPVRKGSAGASLSDKNLDAIRTKTDDMLMLFSNLGKMYRLKVSDIKITTMTDKGTAIGSLLKMENGEKILNIASVNATNGYQYILFTTKNGMIKKTLISEYHGTTKNLNGVKAIKLKDNDSIVSINFINEEDIILFSHNGYALRTSSNNINPQGKLAGGVKGINLNEEDYIINSLVLINKNYIALVDKQGYGKRIHSDIFTNQNRGGKGVKSGVDLIGAELVDNNSKILLLGNKTITVSADSLPECTSRTAIGNKLIKQGNIEQIVVI